ncbi:DnaJ domain-containing protein/TPR_11 domain-containing protein [Cephalotus follicularis]|uniref:DnaJ domain-containing protein/TPR_11 domain-containing protein n=1 Tax=Cephalotus follicularis TaxID=3775 RepID=A0A1Q3CQL7_CEPFO|nr:DnaJ domain-containing protein/TPR_11 domain-containing protein [Cephalotus follicularis]
MATSPCLTGSEKKHWWLSNRKVVDKYIKDAKNLIATQEQSEIASALTLLDSALALSPRYEMALELKARSLLYLGRFKDVADMLQDYIPSLKMANDDSGSVSSDNSSQQHSRERVMLLHSNSSSSDSLVRDPSFKCFSVSDLKKKVMAGLCKNCEKEGQWRYLVLGQACSHLGLMEDALALLQTGKRLATAAFRRESICWSDDSFNSSNFTISCEISAVAATPPATPPRHTTDSESMSQLLSHIKLLIRRRTAAMAALDAGLYSEAIRHFSKIVDGRRGAPQGFLAECYMHRASAYKAAGRIAESIADCNKTLALDPTCIHALDTRASLLETIRCLPDCLHDLEHLKLLCNSILRDRKLPGPAWKRHNVRYREIPGKLCTLTCKIQQLKQRVASGETGNVDYYALIGLRRGCSRSELERAHLLLCLRHKPDKSTNFIERCELADERDVDSVKDRAKMSALLLYRLLQKGYSSVMTTIMDEEAAEKQRKNAAAALQAAQAAAMQAQQQTQMAKLEQEMILSPVDNSGCNRGDNSSSESKSSTSSNTNAFQGVFCRDLATVGNLLSQVGFNRPIPVKYEALSC